MKLMLRYLFLALFCPLFSYSAEVEECAVADSLAPEHERELRLLIDADAFIVDNEFEGSMATGYTLPGTWVQPRLSYDPLSSVHLELGLHTIFFNGATRYPNFAFHDIARWKGPQYRKGIHALPWFRADAAMGPVSVTLGALHRQRSRHQSLPCPSAHDLALPLYNPECLHSADPEMGAQVQLSLPHYGLDLWIDWQSFIYRQDIHQEAFTAGLTQQVNVKVPQGEGWGISLPVQLLFQHRGGEIDATDEGAQTLGNAGVGLRAEWLTGQRVLTQVGGEAMALHSMQLKGLLWPHSSGDAIWASAGARLWDRLEGRVGYIFGYRFVSIYGAPFFGTLSLADGKEHPHVSTGYYRLAYTHPFGSDFAFTASVDGYLHRPFCDDFSHSMSLGLCFRAYLDFLLKSFKAGQ